MLGRRITGKRLGIIGMGRIGQALALRARAFGMSIHYHNRRRVAQQIEEALEATYWDSLDQMLARMDFISVNCPHTPATYHLLSARRLKHLRPEAIVINTARGEVIDEAALTRMLEAGEIASAGLDVFEHAPAVSDKLIALANAGKVTLLPHLGSATTRAATTRARRSSSTSRPSWTATARPTACCRACCKGAQGRRRGSPSSRAKRGQGFLPAFSTRCAWRAPPRQFRRGALPPHRSANASRTASAPKAAAKLRRSQVSTRGRSRTWRRAAAANTP